MSETEALARELHDITFAFAHTMRPWDGLTQASRDVFMRRARRMIDEGWTLIPTTN
jgi:hypothetical protein